MATQKKKSPVSPARLRKAIHKYQKDMGAENLTHAVEMLSVAVDISDTRIFKYLTGDPMPEKRIAAFCEELRCSPYDLMSKDWIVLYDGLLADVEDFIFDTDTEFLEKSSELRGWSRELRQWRRFFETSKGGDEDVEKSDAQTDLEEELEKAMMPLGSGEPDEEV